MKRQDYEALDNIELVGPIDAPEGPELQRILHLMGLSSTMEPSECIWIKMYELNRLHSWVCYITTPAEYMGDPPAGEFVAELHYIPNIQQFIWISHDDGTIVPLMLSHTTYVGFMSLWKTSLHRPELMEAAKQSMILPVLIEIKRLEGDDAP